MNDETYNGWANYETWLVGLWLDNDRGSYEYWREQAAEHWREAPSTEEVKDGTWTRENATKYNLADQIKEEIEDNIPLPDAGLYTDLLNGALSEVRWKEVAEKFLVDIEETTNQEDDMQLEKAEEENEQEHNNLEKQPVE